MERCLELMQRERHARAEVVLGASSDAINTAWAAVRSLATAEAKRINQLLYCVRLRAMIMPLRYQTLHALLSVSGKPRQPVPQEFEGGTPEEAEAFLEHLLDVANSEHSNFVAMLVHCVDAFNRASTPAELGLDKETFPFKIWRDQVDDGGTKSKVKKKASSYKPSVGEVIYVTEESAGTRKANGSYAYFLGFTADDQLLVQLSGKSQPVRLPPERIRACRGAAVLIPGPVKK